MSTDPKEVDWDVYSYCSGDPANYIDPYGDDLLGVGLVFGGALVGGYVGGLAGNNWDPNPGNWTNWGPAGIGMLGGVAVGAGIWYEGNWLGQAARGAQAAALEGAKSVPWEGLSKVALQSLMRMRQSLETESFNPSWNWVRANPYFQEYGAYEPAAYYYQSVKTGEYRLGNFLQPVFAETDPAGSFDVRQGPQDLGPEWKLRGIAHYHWGTNLSTQVQRKLGVSQFVTQKDKNILNRLIARRKFLPRGSSILAGGKSYISEYNSSTNILRWLTRLF